MRHSSYLFVEKDHALRTTGMYGWVKSLAQALTMMLTEVGVGLAGGFYLSGQNLLAYIGYSDAGIDVFVDRALPALSAEVVIAAVILTVANYVAILPRTLWRRRPIMIGAASLGSSAALGLIGFKEFGPGSAFHAYFNGGAGVPGGLVTLQMLALVGVLASFAVVAMRFRPQTDELTGGRE